MKVQLFTIRIDAEKAEFDQNSLNDFLLTVTFKKSTVHFVESDDPHWSVLLHYDDEEAHRLLREQDNGTAIAPELTIKQQEILGFLKQWRNDKSAALNFSAYMVAHNSELINVVIQNPQTVAQLRKIKGFGELKTARYGAEIIAILKAQSD